MAESWRDPRVAAVRLRTPFSRTSTETEPATALAHLAAGLGWANDSSGPFGEVIPAGARVLVKPNFVMHENRGPWGMAPLVTDPALIRSVVEAALRAGASRVLVGDAPLQSCKFDHLLRVTALDAWASELRSCDARFDGLRDFRRTKSAFRNGIRESFEDQLPRDQFVLFDLGSDSLLEEITTNRASFRVTQYSPQEMVKTHGPGVHQYLVAKDVIESDVIINLPKLKTHKKAGITCALKNLIGINGNKEYLPHHRVNGTASGGDCYPGRSLIKEALEYAFDRQNLTKSHIQKTLWHDVARILNKILHITGDELGIEGSWSGNDTIWRTCLDLNRIVLYGRADGTLADRPQRTLVHVVDAVVAGQGDGPLAPQPLELNLLLAGGSAAAIDWIAAQLLGYDPERIPISREAFGRFRWPLVSFQPGDVLLHGDLGVGKADDVLKSRPMMDAVLIPSGWRDAARNGSALEHQ